MNFVRSTELFSRSFSDTNLLFLFHTFYGRITLFNAVDSAVVVKS